MCFASYHTEDCEDPMGIDQYSQLSSHEFG